MERVEEMLQRLEGEVVETRNQTIKTDNSLRNLVADVKAIARRQEAYESRLTVNSTVAYALFAALSFGGLFLFFGASIDRAELDRALVAQQQETLQARIAALEAEVDRRASAEEEAYAFYELLTSDRRDEIVERFPTVQGRLVDRATIELFRREVDRIRHELARESYAAGRAEHENGNWVSARDAFLRSIAYVELAPYSAELHYALADSLFQLDDFAGAVRYYDLALGSDALPRADAIIGTFRRAESLRRIDRLDDAAEAFSAFARRYDSHRWARDARARLESIRRQQGDD